MTYAIQNYVMFTRVENVSELLVNAYHTYFSPTHHLS